MLFLKIYAIWSQKKFYHIENLYPVLLSKIFVSHQSVFPEPTKKIRNIQQVWKTIKMTENFYISRAALVALMCNGITPIFFVGIPVSHLILLDNFRMKVPLKRALLMLNFSPLFTANEMRLSNKVCKVQLNQGKNQSKSKWMPLVGSVCFLSFSWRKFWIRWAPCERPTTMGLW